MRRLPVVVFLSCLVVVGSAFPALASTQVPTGLRADQTNSVTPKVSGVVSSSTGASVTGKFFVRTHGSSTVDVVNGQPSGVLSSGATASLTLSQGKVRIATTYDYWMQTCDSAGANCSASSATQTFTVNPQLGAGERGSFTQLTRRIDNDIVVKLNVGSGNLLLEYQGVSLRGVSGSLGIGLAYNSLQVAGPHPAPLAGYGWIPSTKGTRYQVDSDGSVTVYGPTGDVKQFTGSSLQEPPGADADLSQPSDCNGGSGYQLVEHARQRKTRFCASSSNEVSRISDRNGQGFTFDFPASGGDQTDVTSDYGTSPGNQVTFSGITFASASQTDGTTTRSFSVAYTGSDLTTLTDLRSKTTTFGYDASHNLTSITTPGGEVTQIVYDSAHRVTSFTQDPTGVDATTTLAYPSVGTTKVTDPDSNTTTYDVDYADRVTKTTDPYGRSRSDSYTNDDHLASVVNGNGGTATLSYHNGTAAPVGPWGDESLSGVSDSTSGASFSLEYGNSGTNAYLPSAFTDASQRKTLMSYDGFGNLSGESSGTTSSTVHRNSDGTIDYVQAASGDRFTYHYATPSNHMLTSVTPPTGTPTNSLGTVTLSYDGFNRIGSRGDGRSGETASMTYNLDDQLTVMSYSDGTHDVRYTYNPDGFANVRGDGQATTSWFFDNLNRLTATVTTAPPPNGVFPTRATAPTCPTGASGSILCYGYDAASNLTSVATAEGVTAYSYSKTNLMDAIDEPGGVLDLFGYDHDGKRVDSWLDATGTNVTFPPAYDATNTIKAPTGFAAHLHSRLGDDNQLLELVTTRNSSDTTKVADITYSYADSIGDKTNERYSASDSVAGTTANYVYNGLDRLTSATGSSTCTFCYNANGDLTTYSGTSLAYNSADQITTTGYGYDGAGNLTTAPAGAITYNGGDQMTSVTPTGGTAASFTYTGLGQSELTQSSQTTFQNSAVGPVASTFNSGTSYYTRDPQGELVSLRTQTGAEYFPAFDGIGSVTTLIDTTGAVAATWTYNAYGKSTGSSGVTGATRFRFAGGWQDGTTSYYHFGDRWYDPASGRWTQQDPVAHIGDLAQGNQYAYASDNPVNFTDPTGQSIFGDVLKGLGLVAAGAAVFATGGLAIGLGAAAVSLDVAGGVASGDSATEIGISAGLDVLTAGVGPAAEAVGVTGTSLTVLNGTYFTGNALFSAATTYGG